MQEGSNRGPYGELDLTARAKGTLFNGTSRPGGRCRGSRASMAHMRGTGGGKSGLHGDTVAANGRRGRPQGKCHRKQTASFEVRVKGCGKSAPRRWRHRRQGKPHREQDQIGAAGRARKRGARCVSRPAARVGCLRRSAMGVPDEWPSRRGNSPDRTRLTGRLVLFLSPPACAMNSSSPFSPCGARLRQALRALERLGEPRERAGIIIHEGSTSPLIS